MILMKLPKFRLIFSCVLVRYFVTSFVSFLVFSILVFFSFLSFSLFSKTGESISVAAKTAVEETGAAWVKVMDLKVGDLLYTEKGWQEVESIEYVQSDAPFSVYNLSVGGPNTFWANGLLAHNKDNCGVTGIVHGLEAGDSVNLGFHDRRDPVNTYHCVATSSGGDASCYVNVKVVDKDVASYLTMSNNPKGYLCYANGFPPANPAYVQIKPRCDGDYCMCCPGGGECDGNLGFEEWWCTKTVTEPVAWIQGRVRSYEPEEWFWRLGDCTGCTNCHSSSTLTITCSKEGGSSITSGWDCNSDAYYYNYGNDTFFEGDTVTCTLSGLPSGYTCSNPAGCSRTGVLTADNNDWWFDISKDDPNISLSGQVYCKDKTTGTAIPWGEGVVIRHHNGANITMVATSDSYGRWTAVLPKSTWLGPSASSIRPDGLSTGIPEFEDASKTDDFTWDDNGIDCEDSNVEGVAFDAIGDIYENQPGGCLRGESDTTLTNTTVDFNLGYCPASTVGCNITNMSNIVFDGVGQIKYTPALTVVLIGADVLNVEFTVNDPSVAQIIGSSIANPPVYSVEMESLALTGSGEYTYTAKANLDDGVSFCTETAKIIVNPPGPWCQIKGGDAVTLGNVQCHVPEIPKGLYLMEEAESGSPGIPIAGGSIVMPTDSALISSMGWKVENDTYGGELPSYEHFREKIPDLVPEAFASSNVYQTTLLNSGTEYPIGSGYYYFEFDGPVLNIWDNMAETDGITLDDRKVIIFADSDVEIHSKILVNRGRGLFMIISSGDIEIDPSVSGDFDSSAELEGIYYTDKDFKTSSLGVGTDKQLHVRGSVVAGNVAGFGVEMGRYPAEADVPGELFEFGVDQSMLIPPQLCDRLMTWKEVLP